MKLISIEPLNISAEKKEKLEELMKRQDIGSFTKNRELQFVSAKCSRCSGLASVILKYRRMGVIMIERYCDECLKLIPIPKSKRNVRT
jgi:hypothetical protein